MFDDAALTRTQHKEHAMFDMDTHSEMLAFHTSIGSLQFMAMEQVRLRYVTKRLSGDRRANVFVGPAQQAAILAATHWCQSHWEEGTVKAYSAPHDDHVYRCLPLRPCISHDGKWHKILRITIVPAMAGTETYLGAWI